MINIPGFTRTINSRRKKYTSIRTLRLFLYKGLTKVPFLRRRFAIYVETISPNEVGNVIVNKLYEETFSLSNEERNYLESLPQSSGELVINGKLNLKKRFEMTIVSNCSVLGKVSVSLHLPTEKLS